MRRLLPEDSNLAPQKWVFIFPLCIPTLLEQYKSICCTSKKKGEKLVGLHVKNFTTKLLEESKKQFCRQHSQINRGIIYRCPTEFTNSCILYLHDFDTCIPFVQNTFFSPSLPSKALCGHPSLTSSITDCRELPLTPSPILAEYSMPVAIIALITL